MEFIFFPQENLSSWLPESVAAARHIKNLSKTSICSGRSHFQGFCAPEIAIEAIVSQKFRSAHNRCAPSIIREIELFAGVPQVSGHPKDHLRIERVGGV
jgi:hypothetical protein